ncbi:DUF1566 domain-containing protein, partial [bacterium]|nr:DUF1566 domain-containing protein [bacterium]
NTGETQNCTNLPANAAWKISTYTPFWIDEAWSTEPAATYFEDEGEECTYECATDYHYEEGSCQSDTRPAESCGELPENAEWVNGDTYIPTWNGKGYPYKTAHYAEEGDCAYICVEGYEWDLDTVSCQPLPYCGDGIIQNAECENIQDQECIAVEGMSEFCDEGEELNGTYGHCNADCTAILTCGDGIVSEDEEACDDGNMNGAYGHCNALCTAILTCGDGIIDKVEEACDEGELNGTYGHCNADCTDTIRCGDGILNGDELCDDGELNNGQYGFCNEDCTLCGDDEFHIENGHCVSNDGSFVECEGEIPEYSYWVNKTYYTYWTNTGELGSGDGYWYEPEPRFSEEEEECSFRCLDGFVWNEDEGVCECPEERPLNTDDINDPYCELVGDDVEMCGQKPENTVWTDDGQHGMFHASLEYMATTQYCGGDTGDCCYDCAEDYHFLSTNGTCESDYGEPTACTGLIENAEWVGNGTYTPFWTEEAGWSRPSAVYDQSGEADCAFKCVEGYAWNDIRCVPETPYTDPESELTWSALASDKMNWGNAGPYCENLTEGGYTDWRLPNIDELRTLIQNCAGSQTDGACRVSDPDYLATTYNNNNSNCYCGGKTDGSYSKLGDDNNINLWSSSKTSDTEGRAWLVGFYRGNINHSSTSDSNDVRCVRSATRQVNCAGLPANAEWNSASSITQKWNGSSWYPAKTAVYGEEASTTECRFKCSASYFWVEEECKHLTLGNICTGQTSCYNESSSMTCPTSSSADFYGQDAQHTSKCTVQSFTAGTGAQAGTVIDNNTGLVWEQSSSTEKYSWDNAQNHCNDLNTSNYGGKSNWRVPNPLELLTIIDNSTYNPATNSNFTNMPTSTSSGFIWTSKENKDDTSKAYYFIPGDGSYTNGGNKTSALKVLCVSGDEMQPAESADFTSQTISGSVVVTDSKTGLMWQKEYATGKTWQEALSYCENLAYAGYGDWRLPNKNELASLVNVEKSAKPYSYFPDMPTGTFWSSSTRLNSKSYAWQMLFSTGLVSAYQKSGSYNVRCVR